jgi:foldase protein PrsA
VNSSKKLKAKKVKEVKFSDKPITSISKPWLISSLVLVVLLIGALLFDQLYSPTLMTIDGKKYNLRDVSYYVYSVESSYNSYGSYLGDDFWDMTADEDTGTTMREQSRQDAINEVLKYEMLNNEAKSQGYKLTDDEKKTINTNVESLLASDQMTTAVIKKNNFTKSYLTKIISKMTLAERYRDDQIAKLDIDDAKIKDGVSFDDYRQYDMEYIFISTQTTDADGNDVDISDAEKATALDKINAVYDTAKTASDWSSMVSSEDPDLTYEESSFVVNDSTFSKDFEAMMEKMDNGDVSDVYTDTTGYYIVRMKDNKATEAYDDAVTSAISDAENSAFNDLFESTIKPNHPYTLKNKALNKLKMGSVTL